MVNCFEGNSIPVYSGRGHFKQSISQQSITSVAREDALNYFDKYNVMYVPPKCDGLHGGPLKCHC